MSRCTGHCCEAFAVPLSPDEVAQLRHDYYRSRAGGADYGRLVEDGPILADMLIPLGFGLVSDVAPARAGVVGAAGWAYTCRHFDRETRDCGIYERRPSMCRRYPYGHRCNYAGCTCDGTIGVDEPCVGMEKFRRVHDAPRASVAYVSWAEGQIREAEELVRRIAWRLDGRPPPPGGGVTPCPA